jgi:hypothetical protein
VSPVHHDDTNYGTSLSYRGNLTSTTRWDVANPMSSTYSVSTSSVYNTAGSPISQTDARGRVTSISYADLWWDNVSRTTLAYPTTITDPGSNASTIKYRFDTGANVWTRSPTPYGSGNTYGKTTSITYSDTTGRIIKDKIDSLGGAYTRYEYPSNGNSLIAYSTIIDVNTDGVGGSADEVATETFFDGAGRAIGGRSPHTFNTNGTTAHWSGITTQYDILGRPISASIPTEIDSSWAAAGDDSARGWKYNQTEYDWKGRVTRTVPSDSTGSDGKDTLFEYGGCGCAGGQVTTTKGPVTTAIDHNGATQTTKRRWQMSYEDPLGRTFKTEQWDLDGASLYTTIRNTFNDRDQLTKIEQFDGDVNGVHQDTDTAYDGHGRVVSLHKPEWIDSSDDPTATTYTYNPDDTVKTMTDPRGVETTYEYGYADDVSVYEYRNLLTSVSYTAPTGIHPPAEITFEYDAAGNRKKMTDETGVLDYTYDELSRLKKEAKNFSYTLTGEPPSGTYDLSYTYLLGGGLRSMTDPFDHEVNYSTDKLGRVIKIGDASSDTKYAQVPSYRAFGAVKEMSLSATAPVNISLTYNNALRPATYVASSTANTGDIHNNTYSYFNDGMLSGNTNSADAKFTQSSVYDFAGRLRVNNVGTGTTGYPYIQELSYDVFDHIATRDSTTYAFTPQSFSAEYQNNRKTSGGATTYYDDAGNVIETNDASVDHTTWTFDAAGRPDHWEEEGPWGSTLKKGANTAYDGDGRPVKKAELINSYTIPGGWSGWDAVDWYYIYSSVTEQKITDTILDGSFGQTHIYMGSSIIAEQSESDVDFKVNDPVTGSMWGTFMSGVKKDDLYDGNRTELAGLNTAIPEHDPSPAYPHPEYDAGGYSENPENGCEVEGVVMPCDAAQSYKGWIQALDETFENLRKKHFTKKQSKAREMAWIGGGSKYFSALGSDSGGNGDRPCPEGQHLSPNPETGELVCVADSNNPHEEVTVTPDPEPVPKPTGYTIDNRSFIQSTRWGWWVRFGVPQSVPTPTPTWRPSQQDEYEDCVRKETSKSLNRGLTAGLQVHAGTSLMFASGAMAGYGGGYFVKEAIEGRTGNIVGDVFNTTATLSHVWIPIAGNVPGYGVGYSLADSGVNTLRLNPSVTSAAIRNCRVLFPISR